MTTAQEDPSNYKEDKDKQSQSSSIKTTNKNYDTSGLDSEIHNVDGTSDRRTHKDDDDNNDDEILYGYEFKMTDDQKKAAGELQDLKLDLGFTAEDEPGPFYDVSERLRQLNKELAQEQIPEVEERNRKIQFKENLVDFVAPPPDHDMEDEMELSRRDEQPNNHSDSDSGESAERKADVKTNGLTVEQKDVERSSSRNSEQGRISDSSSEKGKVIDNEPGDGTSRKELSQNGISEDEKVVLERNGRFEVIAVKDLTPEEREIYVTGPSSVVQPVDPSKSVPDSAKSSSVKKPERKTSVASSISPTSDSRSSSRRTSKSSQEAGATSARSNSNGDSQKVPTSARPSSQSGAQKKQPPSSMSNMEKYERKRKEDEEKRQKKEESDRVFQAWLDRKNEEEKKKKQDKKEKDDDEEEEKEKNDKAFKKWKAKKEQQMQKEKKMKEEETKYYESYQWQTHSDSECEKNFKTWIKEKRKKAKEKEEEERQKMKTFRATARRSRNSSKDGSVGAQSGSAYIDYYGYRF